LSAPFSDRFQSNSMGDRDRARVMRFFTHYGGEFIESSAKRHRTDRSLPVAMQSDQHHLIIWENDALRCPNSVSWVNLLRTQPLSHDHVPKIQEG
jgi:hypothetical protein